MFIKRQSQLVLLLLLLALSAANSAQQQCMADRGYCQTHRECCSGKCMTYSYMCAPKVSSLPAVIDFKTLYEEATVDSPNSLNDNHLYNIIKQAACAEPCRATGEECQINMNCCSRRCHSYLHKCVT
ncbi:uncharacterized protein LOC108602664 [Drosophila busckii]|uniref:uncharacterized protein LOC108602664 n=1 Tax=Drosophila busckii TaxID=30019 RepID=UPI00083F4984|nr:uncharacterized protein LOC108602664 [Drosophila busckii]